MSLVNPLNRWWNRTSVRRALGWACWGIGAIAAAVASLAFAIETDFTTSTSVPAWLSAVGMIVAMAGLLGGIFLHAIASGPADMDPRLISHPIAVMFLIFGVVPIGYGLIEGRPASITFIVFAVVGVLALVIAEIVIRRGVDARRIRTAVQRGGTRTSGVVTRATGYQHDYSMVTKVTVRFVDGDGRERWASETLAGTFAVGARVGVRYLPRALGRRGAVIIEAG